MAVDIFRVQAYRYPSGISDDDVSIEIFSLKTRIVFPIPATTADDCIKIKKTTISDGDNDGGGW